MAAVTAAVSALVAGLFNAEGGGTGGARGESVTGGPAGPGGDGASPECLGGGCQGRDGDEFGCGPDAQVLAERAEPIRLQLKYSPTCQAAWAKILDGEKGDRVTVSSAGGKSVEAVIAYGHDNYTKMVSAEGQFALTACAESDDADGAPRWKRFCVDATVKDVK
ncbi:DUF2690 domain-containing protein [Streptomyces sp. 8N706]|uniref:DUF2690 domain-containing protein n=1 Tax=Streptomyces sp. 8N706 TaxID=3457416 RepID=UPI003FD486D8